jgi:hypothetical protein
MLTPA